jgi:signal peptidase I
MRGKSIIIAALAGGALCVLAVPLRPTVVLGQSMAPTLRSGGFYVLNTAYYRRRSIRRGDVVVFRHRGETCTKRVYAVPGQHVLLLRYDDGIGNETVDAWQAAGLRRLAREHHLASEHLEELIVPPGYCFVIGDNRPVSYDSRSFGCIPISEILGHVGL